MSPSPPMAPHATLRGHLTRIRTHPGTLGDGIERVRRSLLPMFMDQPGSRHATCMADRDSGTIVVVTSWQDEDALAEAAPAMGRARTEVVEATGALVSQSGTYDLNELDVGGPHLGGDGAWSLVVTVEGLPTSGRGVDDAGIGSMLRAPGGQPGLPGGVLACRPLDRQRRGDGRMGSARARRRHRPRTRRQRRVLQDSVRGGITNVQVCETFAAARCAPEPDGHRPQGAGPATSAGPARCRPDRPAQSTSPARNAQTVASLRLRTPRVT
jgi:hypothetical protein